MADEITTTIGFTIIKGLLKKLQQTEVVTFDMAGTNYTEGVQAIGNATHELLQVSADIGTAGLAWFYNLSDTNNVQIGTDDTGTFHPFALLLPGQMALVPMNTTAIYAKAAAGSVDLQYLLCEA